MDAIVLALGADEDVVYSKTGTSQVWLLGYELTDTIIVMAEKSILILASKKKIDFLKPLESGKENEKDVPPVALLIRNKVCLRHFVAGIIRVTNMHSFPPLPCHHCSGG